MANRWLVKTEPGEYSYADLERDGRTSWEGVRNALALRHLAEMRKGDEVLVYHTGREKSVVGIARVARAGRAGAKPGREPPAPVVLVPTRRLERPVPLSELRDVPELRSWDLLRMSRLSVMPVPAAAWKAVMEASRP